MTEKISREIVLSGLHLSSWNQFYSCEHWTLRKKEVDRIKHEVIGYLDPELPGLPIPVDIEVEVYRKDRHLVDPDNIPAKLLIDCLRGWIIPTDDPTSVHRVSTISSYDKDNPRVVIRVISLEGSKPWGNKVDKEESEV